MIATDMTTGGSVEERLRWAFKMYDQDGSGEVNLIIIKTTREPVKKGSLTCNFISMFNNFITYDMIGIIELHEMEDIVIKLFELNDGSLV